MSPMRQHGIIDSHSLLSREPPTEVKLKLFLSSLRDFRDCLFLFRGLTPTATSCHRFAVMSACVFEAQFDYDRGCRTDHLASLS